MPAELDEQTVSPAIVHSTEKLMSTKDATGIKAAIRSFVLNSINLAELNDDDDLFATGIVNSLFAVQLMTFIEKTFQIEVGVEDLDIENFKSIQAATGFVVKKNGRVAA